LLPPGLLIVEWQGRSDAAPALYDSLLAELIQQISEESAGSSSLASLLYGAAGVEAVNDP